MIRQEEIFPIGTIHKPHALQGEVSCTFHDFAFDEQDAPYIILEMDGIYVPFFIEAYRFKSETTALLKLEGIDTEDAARMLAEKTIYLPITYRTELTADTAGWDDLTGFTAIDIHHGALGQIVHVDDSTLNTLFVIQHDGEELYIPANENFVREVDYRKRQVILEVPETLLHLDQADTDD